MSSRVFATWNYSISVTFQFFLSKLTILQTSCEVCWTVIVKATLQIWQKVLSNLSSNSSINISSFFIHAVPAGTFWRTKKTFNTYGMVHLVCSTLNTYDSRLYRCIDNSPRWAAVTRTFDTWVSGERSCRSLSARRSFWWSAAVPGLTLITESTHGPSRSRSTLPLISVKGKGKVCHTPAGV